MSEDTNKSEERNTTQIIYVTSFFRGRQREDGPRRNSYSDTADPGYVYTQVVEVRPLNM